MPSSVLVPVSAASRAIPASHRSTSAALPAQNLPTCGCGRIRKVSWRRPATTASATWPTPITSADEATARAAGEPELSPSISNGVSTPIGQSTLTRMLRSAYW